MSEINIVLENRCGEVPGIEVKASATVHRRTLPDRANWLGPRGSKFVQGLVLYDWDQVMPFG